MENVDLKKALLSREIELSAEIKARMERRKEYKKNLDSKKIKHQYYSDLNDKFSKTTRYFGR